MKPNKFYFLHWYVELMGEEIRGHKFVHVMSHKFDRLGWEQSCKYSMVTQ